MGNLLIVGGIIVGFVLAVFGLMVFLSWLFDSPPKKPTTRKLEIIKLDDRRG
jgi:hypothetical protein